MFNQDLINSILIEPISRGANKLLIVSGYASHTMASWHLKKIKDLGLPLINIELIVGMALYDGLKKDIHQGFKDIQSNNNHNLYSHFQCQYVIEQSPVHSKVYIWLNNDLPVEAYTGSANYSQAGFSLGRREYMVPCNPNQAFQYYNNLVNDSMFCNHNDIEDYITLMASHHVLENEMENSSIIFDNNFEKVTLSLLDTRTNNTHLKSGLNWGQRNNREPNQAYIPIPSKVAKSGFFPLESKHFSVLTDDHKNLVLRVQQQGNKALTTPMNNSLIGEYFRNRLGLNNGQFVTRQHLEDYGRTDVTFYKLDDEQFYMDFSPH